jgi:cysteinyl-tRNA synthetase
MRIMDDDLDFSRALSFLWEVLRDENLNGSEKYELAVEFDKVLGLKLNEDVEIEIPDEVLKLVKTRENARKKKHWREADEVRNRIRKFGFAVNDSDDGTKLIRVGENIIDEGEEK